MATTSVGDLKELAHGYITSALDGVTGISPLTVRFFKEKMENIIEERPDLTPVQLLGLLILKANENVAEMDEDGNFKNVEPGWVKVSARFFLESLYTRASQLRNTPINDLYSADSFKNGMEMLIEEGVYDPSIVYAYTEDEIVE